MKPAWDKLMAEFEGSKSAGIFDVDCTAAGKGLCEEVGIKGYPTIKYGDPGDKNGLQDYSGERDFESLKKFAEENLGPICGPESMDACDDVERPLLEEFLKKPSEELMATAKKLSKSLSDADKKLTKRKSKLKEKRAEFDEDKRDYSKIKVKKGKEKEHAEKGKKLDMREEKLKSEEAKLDEDIERHKMVAKKSGVKLMKLAADENKGRTDL
mmetsp:Transcript_89416/g.251816  ORF Transcript_89416/g.251816 Transcript_89416/m.251816 type:complete len:212 (+) Transcript_89416:237-872(+)|eukprot:CAMPEP_0117544686 /NCGR_PEP_ID=MMETSP0784-20121206/45703_1 /TAXON_ID=39447 /ORGANISM="" /LENGTH=211 /DNA_ID=CAMNT_0005341501 /DNA_START=234 /DNA_END=869 /DNA_ORIENTATION=-